MAVECALDLKDHNVAFVSLWPNAVKTEHIKDMLQDEGPSLVKNVSHLFTSFLTMATCSALAKKLTDQ